MKFRTELEKYVTKARAFAAFPSGSLQTGDEIVSSALVATHAVFLAGDKEPLSILLFREIAKAISDEPLDITDEHRCIQLRFQQLTPRERIAFWLVEFSLFSDRTAAQILELEHEEFSSLLSRAYRKFFQGIAFEQPCQTLAPDGRTHDRVYKDPCTA